MVVARHGNREVQAVRRAAGFRAADVGDGRGVGHHDGAVGHRQQPVRKRLGFLQLVERLQRLDVLVVRGFDFVDWQRRRHEKCQTNDAPMSVGRCASDNANMPARWLLGLHICAAAAFVHLLSARCNRGGTARQAFVVAATVPALALPVWDAEYPEAFLAVLVVVALLPAPPSLREVVWVAAAALAVVVYFLQPDDYVWLVLILGLLSVALLGNRAREIPPPPMKASAAVVALLSLGGGATASDRAPLIVSAAVTATLAAVSLGV